MECFKFKYSYEHGGNLMTIELEKRQWKRRRDKETDRERTRESNCRRGKREKRTTKANAVLEV